MTIQAIDGKINDVLTLQAIEAKINDILAGRGRRSAQADVAELAELHKLRNDRVKRGGADAGEMKNYWALPEGGRVELREGLEKFTGRPSVYCIFTRPIGEADRTFLSERLFMSEQFLEDVFRGRITSLPVKLSEELRLYEEALRGRPVERLPEPVFSKPHLTCKVHARAQFCVARADGAAALFIRYSDDATRSDAREILVAGPTLLAALLPRVLKAGFGSPAID